MVYHAEIAEALFYAMIAVYSVFIVAVLFAFISWRLPMFCRLDEDEIDEAIKNHVRAKYGLEPKDVEYYDPDDTDTGVAIICEVEVTGRVQVVGKLSEALRSMQ